MKSRSCIGWLILLLTVSLLAGCAVPPSRKSETNSRPFEVENNYVTLTQSPRCRFKWVGWNYVNTRNPLLFTRDSLNQSLIGIMRVPAGATLPNGKTPIRPGMNFQDLTALLKENVQNRPDSNVDFDSITTTKTRVAGHDAVFLAYRTTATPAHQGLECAFESNGWLFYFTFSTIDDFRYSEDAHDFELILGTFTLLQ